MASLGLLPKILFTKQTEEASMALKDLMALYGRVTLIVLAFAFVAVIIMGPLLQRALFAGSAVADRSGNPTIDAPKTSIDTMPRRQG